MVKEKIGVALGKAGMNRDAHPSLLQEQEYIIAVNTNYENELGEGIPLLQNEPSNILCTRFKEGFKVIGRKLNLTKNKVIYFLVNPETGASEIGYVPLDFNLEEDEDIKFLCGEDVRRKVGKPLEELEQTPTGEYETVIEGACLNFSINHPIKEGNIVIKTEKCAEVVYWTDNYNPPRYANLDKLKGTVIDCEKLRIFPLFEKPCLHPKSIQYGGNLPYAVYEFLLAYCDLQGNEISSYYSITNPISIFDENNIDLDEMRKNPISTFGIRLEVNNLDLTYNYYKVAVIQRTFQDFVTSYFVEGVHSITDKTILLYTTEDKERITLPKLLVKKPSYERAGIMTASNGYLFQADLEGEKEYNLQPVMNLAGAFVRWQTVKASENLYKDGINNSLYKGYMRDEVYPLSIRFFSTTGFITSNFILANRPPTSQEKQVVNTTDTNSIGQFTPNCAENTRDKRWQYYNTASVLEEGKDTEGLVYESSLDCSPEPYASGKFGYWESSRKYPLNAELFDSSNLVIETSKIPSKIKEEFESYFVSGESRGHYILNDEAVFNGKPIRHYKFPSFQVSPFMAKKSIGFFQDNLIYPLGVTIDPEVLNFFLDVAVASNLITQSQRDKLDKYEIFRGDRTLHKGVIAKGLAYDMYQYDETGGTEEQKDILYSNYPYNDLGDDELNYTDSSRGSLIKHPYGGKSNNHFTFHSPDTHFYKPIVPSEVSVEAYQYGDASGHFAQVEKHSNWVILSAKAYHTATALAITEAVMELMIRYGDFRVQNAVAGDRIRKKAYGGKVQEESKKEKKVDLTHDFNAGISGKGTVTGTITGNPPGTFTSSLQIKSGKKSHKINGDETTTGKAKENVTNYGTIKEQILGGGTLDKIGKALGRRKLPTYKSTQSGGKKGYHSAETDENIHSITGVEKGFIIAGMFGNIFNQIGAYRYEWLKIFKETGQPENFAFYYTSIGWYDCCKANEKEGDMLRGLASKKYLRDGRYSINETSATRALKINNVNRGSSVFLSFGDGNNLTYPSDYKGKDTSRFISSQVKSGQNIPIETEDEDGNKLENISYDSKSAAISSKIASPYMALKTYLPSQYGEVDSIKWIPTGFCGCLKSSELPRIFGGDVFISRFSLKRKMPLFLTNLVNFTDLMPFNYYPYRNIGHTKHYCDYEVSEVKSLVEFSNKVLDWMLKILSLGITGQTIPQFKSHYKFDNMHESSFYVRPPSKFYLFYYGVPQFLVESEINCNYRNTRKGLENDFYPHVGDYLDWTQEKNLSIKVDNTFFYNNIYSKDTTMTGTSLLPATYSKDLYDCLYDAPNGVIYSMQDNSEQDLTDPWLVYKPLDFFQFRSTWGRLMDLKSIESSQILGRFEHSAFLFNAIDVLKERVSPSSKELGTGGIFASRPLEYKGTDLGNAGTQHKAICSNSFGHFWVDAKRGQIFKVDQNGRNLEEITTGLRNWFKLFLPFKILNEGITGLTERDIDNSYKGLGISLGWDSRYKRVFVTKLDYKVMPLYRGRVTYVDGEFFLDGFTKIELNDAKYFLNVSFTVAYSTVLKRWLSYYSFTPNYYVGYHTFFQTGLNYSADSKELGLWTHLLTNKSYQVFYGKRYEWLLEVPVKSDMVNKMLKSVSYWLDTKRYHNAFDIAENRRIGFNKAWIYNNTNNTGQLNLITEKKNDRNQKLLYPKIHDDSVDILATEEDNKWTFNCFFNHVRNELNNNPIWLYDDNYIHKTINIDTLQYNQVWKDRLRGDWFVLRLMQDKESRYKQIFKWASTKELIYG